MELKILGSSSKGNGYVLEAKNEALIIEAGVKLLEAKKKLLVLIFLKWLVALLPTSTMTMPDMYRSTQKQVLLCWL